MKVEGRTAVITGAASGIGRGTAQALAKRGCNLALADLNEEGLAETAALAGGHGVKVSRHRLDVADREAVAAFPEIVLAAHGRRHVPDGGRILHQRLGERGLAGADPAEHQDRVPPINRHAPYLKAGCLHRTP